MKKHFILLGIACAFIGLALGSIALGSGGVKGEEPAMMVSPATIVLGKVDTVTVHTNIPAASVDTDTVRLDRAYPLALWADDRGDLAARFAVADLDLEPTTEAILTLYGSYSGDGAGTFAVEDSVRVK